ncbi:hypothetical protein BDW69DRAFT_68536 [Aspergillus filifer]
MRHILPVNGLAWSAGRRTGPCRFHDIQTILVRGHLHSPMTNDILQSCVWLLRPGHGRPKCLQMAATLLSESLLRAVPVLAPTRRTHLPRHIAFLRPNHLGTGLVQKPSLYFCHYSLRQTESACIDSVLGGSIIIHSPSPWKRPKESIFGSHRIK